MDIRILEKSIRAVFPEKKGKIPLHSPWINNKILDKYLDRILTEQNVSTSGELTSLFEEKIKKLTGASYVLAVNSGTSALHLALLATNIPENSEVLVPSLSYVAPTNAVLYVGAIPHFIEINARFGIDVERLEEHLNKIVTIKNGKSFNKNTGQHISALIGVHSLGFPLNVEALLRLCRKYNLLFIEDAAQALGSKYNEKHVGTSGDVGILSFNGTKILTTGGGGALITQKKEIYLRASHLSKMSKRPVPYQYLHDKLGYNYKMPAWNAALGLTQWEYFPEIIARKHEIQKKYEEMFRDKKEASLILPESPEETIVPWLFPLKLKQPEAQTQILKELNASGIEARAIWKPVHEFKYLSKYPKMNLTFSEKIKNQIINLPGGL